MSARGQLSRYQDRNGRVGSYYCGNLERAGLSRSSVNRNTPFKRRVRRAWSQMRQSPIDLMQRKLDAAGVGGADERMPERVQK